MAKKSRKPNQTLKIPKIILVTGKFLSFISTNLVVQFAARLFTTPIKYKIPKRELEMDTQSRQETIAVVWSWTGWTSPARLQRRPAAQGNGEREEVRQARDHLPSQLRRASVDAFLHRGVRPSLLHHHQGRRHFLRIWRSKYLNSGKIWKLYLF